jgi:hypothetical protein
MAQNTSHRDAGYNRTTARSIETQDTIVQLREAKRLSEERYAEHSRECEAVEEKACAALANKQKKQD